MSEKVLAVRTEQLKNYPDFDGFLGLPKEEIERYRSALEVRLMGRDDVKDDPAYKQLICCTAIHYNYSWLTCEYAAGRSMVICGPIASDRTNQPPLFLDDSHKSSVLRVLESYIRIPETYTLRLAGLLNDDSDDFGRRHLGLIYVLKLNQPGIERGKEEMNGIDFSGSGELTMNRDEFEPWSRILIDNIPAL